MMSPEMQKPGKLRAKPGSPALAVFIMRPQAVPQIGAIGK
jgi:hypothetical protein